MITIQLKKFIKTLQRHNKKEKELQKEPEKIKLNKMIGKLAFFYEKIRNTLDYKDEHLFRKDAIRRIMNRRLIPKMTGEDIARPLINELIRARYLTDNTIPESKINHLDRKNVG